MSKKIIYDYSFKKEIPYTNKNFQKILDFYLHRCPVEGTSVRSITFNQYGWNGSAQYAQLKKRLLDNASSSLKDNYHPSKKDELSRNIELLDLIIPPDEFCAFLKSDEKSVMQSLFKAIRNALAHGSFNGQTINKEKYYYFENYDNYLKAKLMLKENTMLNWIMIVSKGYQPNK